MAESSKLILAYWGTRGLAQPIRFFLDYVNLPYENKTYTDPEVWSKDKAALKTPLPNLPYLIDGEKVVTESDALYHYIAYKAGKRNLIAPEDPEKFVRLATTRGVLADLRIDLSSLIYSKDYDALYETTINNKIKPKLEKLSKYLEDNEWFCGSDITYVDFTAQEVLSLLQAHDSKLLDANLSAFVRRFYELPAIKANEAVWSKVPWFPPGYSKFL
jgi:glutathione S-transferase